MPIEFEVVPETSLKNVQIEFLLGQDICQTLANIQKSAKQYQKVHLLYSHSYPNEKDIIVDLTNEHIRLFYNAISQKLRLIEVYDLTNISLRYGSSRFSEPDDIATVTTIQETFGATHAGVYDGSTYTQSWTGLSFLFSWTNTGSNIAPSPVAGYDKQGLKALPLPRGHCPPVKKLCLFKNENARKEVRQLRFKSLINGKGICQGYQIDGIPTEKPKIYFGEVAEVVLTILGAPSKVYYKGEDKMKIHRPSGEKITKSSPNDYFFNYFNLGLDILFSGDMHTVKKFIFHTNYPGHYDFGIYNRANFIFHLNGENGQKVPVTALTSWQDLCTLSSTAMMAERPVVMSRSSNSYHGENPFVCTFCYAVQQHIFEVMTNGCIASIIVYDEST